MSQGFGGWEWEELEFGHVKLGKPICQPSGDAEEETDVSLRFRERSRLQMCTWRLYWKRYLYRHFGNIFSLIYRKIN